ncbi:MAG TPA: hypothetical protein VKZ88_04970 [Fibrobacteria bacterium]|nr:hypothetical protein [Fibrobacteria bacterium]
MKIQFATKTLAASLIALSLGLTGCLTDSKDDDKEPEVTTPWTADSALTVGAQGHLTLGTAVDLDNRRVLLSAAANQAQDSLDVLFAYHGGSFVLIAPRTAKDSSISVATNYDITKVQYTQFVKVTTEPANWEAGVAAFEAGTKVSYAPIAAADMFVVKTTEENYVLVTVSAITGTDGTGSGTLTVNLKQVAAPAAD